MVLTEDEERKLVGTLEEIPLVGGMFWGVINDMHTSWCKLQLYLYRLPADQVLVVHNETS